MLEAAGKRLGRSGGFRVLKRIALVLALVAALVLTSAAWAVTSDFAGKFESGGTVSFKLNQPESEPATISNWMWTRLRIKCLNGKHRYSGYFGDLPEIVDSELRFHVERVNQQRRGRAILHGHFAKDWESAKGWFKIRGNTELGRRCRSGRVKWRATRVPP